MKSNSFLHPELLGLLILVPIIIFWYVKAAPHAQPTLKVSQIATDGQTKTWRTRTRPYLWVLRVVAFVGMVLALARPISTEKSNFTSYKNGIDIVIATDVSGSMLATDLKPNRLEAVKQVAADFIKNRTNDRIGLVVYAGESYTRTPVTSDHQMVLTSLADVQYNGYVLEDGTAIGIGLATAINRLKTSKSKTKIIILLTDGVNNKGSLDPISAAEIAMAYGIKVYTIGVGTNGIANVPYTTDANGNILYQKQQVEIDEALMQQIASTTKGKYFRATSNEKLAAIYNEIDQLEKTIIKEQKHLKFQEEFRFWLLLAIACLALEFALKKLIYKSFI